MTTTIPAKDIRINGVLRYFQRGDDLVGIFDVKVRDGGGLRIELTVPLRPIEQQIARQARALPSAAVEQLQEDAVSGFAPVAAVRRLAGRVAKNRITARLEKILAHPQAPIAAEVASQLVPGWGATYGAVRAAASLLRRAKRRDPEAAAKLVAVKHDADAGVPHGVEARVLLNRVARQLKAAEAGGGDDEVGCAGHGRPPGGGRWRGRGRHTHDDTVSGWAFNTPYRSVFSAALEPSPGAIHRHLYGAGLAKRAELARR